MSGITFVHTGDYGEPGLTWQQLEFMQGASGIIGIIVVVIFIYYVVTRVL